MNHLNNYLLTVNNFPVYKKSRLKKFLASNMYRFLIISFVLLMAKFTAEYVAECLLGLN